MLSTESTHNMHRLASWVAKSTILILWWIYIWTIVTITLILYCFKRTKLFYGYKITNISIFLKWLTNNLKLNDTTEQLSSVWLAFSLSLPLTSSLLTSTCITNYSRAASIVFNTSSWQTQPSRQSSLTVSWKKGKMALLISYEPQLTMIWPF